jgi:bifunctional UDP-N-acetylglucosamine pyrophosphorylase / glucosamine-1-phosphate N-acetyltransferase
VADGGLGVVVLAAGQGTRMRSRLPKVLHPLAGRPMVGWVLAALAGCDPHHVVVVIGHGAESVRDALPDGVATAVQERQDGTGDATRVGLAALDPACDRVMVLCGDTPLLRPELITRLVAEHDGAGREATMVTAVLPDAGSYGRVVRGPDGALVGVVEARDASQDQLAIGEINAGIFVFSRPALQDALGRLGSDNAQGEVYLPDVLPHMRSIGAVVSDDPDVVAGVNTRVQLAECEAVLQDRLRTALMLDGVTMPDPLRVYLDHDVTVGRDTVLLPGTHLLRGTRVGEGCVIGPDCLVEASEIGDGARLTTARVHDSVVGPGASVGPYAYLRPASRLSEGARVGTFVETKNTVLGPRAKVPHLSYVGDAEVGESTNIGAGNITANYDGFRKHRTVIGARVRTGSDCVFVAPVVVGDDAMTGAGSIITDDVPAGALGIARARQSVIDGFTAKAAAKAAEQRANGDTGGAA